MSESEENFKFPSFLEKINCLFCGKTLPNWKNFQYHIVKNHINEISKEIDYLQKHGSLSNQLNKQHINKVENQISAVNSMNFYFNLFISNLIKFFLEKLVINKKESISNKENFPILLLNFKEENDLKSNDILLDNDINSTPIYSLYVLFNKGFYKN